MPVSELDLITAARAAREHAHARFSNFKVGAALEAADGTIITGCNVENATYGLTICAERVAVFKAISEGHRAFTRIAVVADTAEPTPPCGAIRMFSSTVSVSKILRRSGTKTTPRRAVSYGGEPRIDCPPKRIAPFLIFASSTGRNPEIARTVVLLPAPLVPSRATMLFSGTLSDTP